MIVPNFKDGDAMNWETEMLISGNAYKRVYEKRLEGLKSKYGLKRIDLDILYFLCRLFTDRGILQRRLRSRISTRKGMYRSLLSG